MIAVLDVLLVLAGVVLFVPVGVIAAEVLAFRLPKPAARESRVASTARIAVLMPAHDEARTIGESIAPLAVAASPSFRIVVVADNCSDDTAVVAETFAGTQALVRHDLARRGKGYALEHGVNALRAAPPDVVFILDADCITTPDDVQRASELCLRLQRPVQIHYEMHAPPRASLAQRVAWFAWRFKNLVRNQGALRLGFPSQLNGAGMAFPWAIIDRLQLGTGEIVEDLQLGIDLAIEGRAPVFSLDGSVASTFPSSDQATSTQRTRWEHGHLGVMKREVPRLMGEALRRGRRDLLLAALDLSVPPLALLSMLIGAYFGAMVLWGAFTGRWIPAGVATFTLVVLVFTILRAWWLAGRAQLGLKDIAMVPVYALRKVPLYLRAMTGRREKTWKRTERD